MMLQKASPNIFYWSQVSKLKKDLALISLELHLKNAGSINDHIWWTYKDSVFEKDNEAFNNQHGEVQDDSSNAPK